MDDEIFEIFAEATRVLDGENIPYVVFGGVAVWGYGQRRPTKDIDLLLCPADAERALDALAAHGFETSRLDPKWLYKAARNGASVDLIFEVAGGYMPCDSVLARSRRMEVQGVSMNIIGPEDLILIKMAVIQPDRCADWFDSIAVIKGTGGRLDWDYLIDRSGSNLERLLSLLLYAKTAGCEKEVPEATLRRLASLVGLS